VNARRRFAIALLLFAPLALLPASACKKKPAAGPAIKGTRRPYTPAPPPPTRTLRPGEPTPLPRLPE
jgi:hypothetical protein